MARRKKKKQNIQKRETISELNGFSAGQEIWAKRFPNNEITFGRIVEFYTDEPLGPAAMLYEKKDGKFITVLVETLSIDRPKIKRVSLSKKRKQKIA